MNRTLALSALLTFAPFAHAQRHPLPGMPMVPPPVPHPALGAQPLFGDNSGNSSGGSAPAPAPMPADSKKAPADTSGKKLAGKDMKKAVGKVKALKWLDDLDEAKARSAATGKPILLLQALGDIDGFA